MVLYKKLKKIFIGRIARVDFYLAVILHGIIIVGLGWCTLEIYKNVLNFSPDLFQVLNISMLVLLTLVGIIVMVSLFSLIVRRLHDMNISGNRLFIIFVPFMNIFFALYIFLFPGTKGLNSFGESTFNHAFLDIILNRQTVKIDGDKQFRQIVALLVFLLQSILLFIYL